jgi:hypothetical protein
VFGNLSQGVEEFPKCRLGLLGVVDDSNAASGEIKVRVRGLYHYVENGASERSCERVL